MPPIQIPVPPDSYVIVLNGGDIGLLWVVFAVACFVCFVEWHDIFDPKRKKEGK